MGEDKWVVRVEETLVRSKTFELGLDDFDSQEEANKFIAEALQNFSFDELGNKTGTKEKIEEWGISINGEHYEDWSDE